jgi:hypothetical protein
MLTVMLNADYFDTLSGRSFWWTNGGSNAAPMIYARNALPDPQFYVNMIKGSLE